ncbi:MAG: apolipoprotein N-acyltransferase [Candidatus Omnitrophica bacterium]|nr:apolipoprotein N-acyltransferase [Candidatus Omnitrophota bacterium]
MLRTLSSVLQFFSSSVLQLKGKSLILCFLSAILLALSFPRASFWISAWFGFVPLFFALENKSGGRAFLLGFITGIIFWLGTVYWLIHVTLPGTVLLVLYLALYFGIFAFVFPYLLPTNYCLLSIPATWVLLEYIRAHLFTGFPWALLGHSQYLNLPVIQISDIFGAWGVSFLLMMANVSLYRIRVYGLRARGTAISLFCILAVITYGYYQMYHLAAVPSRLRLKVCVIQANIPQEKKWDKNAVGFILDRYSELSREASLKKPDLIIWPEAASPGVLGEDDWVFEEFFALNKRIRIPMLIGAVVREKDIYYNSALLIEEGRITGRYDKLHLVPFGEYVPLKKFLPFLEAVVPIGDIARGEEYTIFKAVDPRSRTPVSFAVLNCFEDLFPELSRQFVKKGAQFLVNITNDAWYKKTSASYQHLQASVFRAVENRIYLARSANTGISGFISPSGIIVSRVRDNAGRDIFVEGCSTLAVPAKEDSQSIYCRLGDFFIPACLLSIFYGIIRARRKNEK